MLKAKHILMIISSMVLFLFTNNFNVIALHNDVFDYKIINDEAIITYVNSRFKEIPDKIDGYPVTKIDSGTFYGYIGSRNIYDNIKIPDSVKKIGVYAFGETALESVDIPYSVEAIGDYAFRNCKKLKSINVDTRNTSYCSENGTLFNYEKTHLIQYSGCDKRTEYQISEKVNKIDDGAFNYCYNLKSINVDSSNKYYSSEDGVLFNYNKTDLIQYPIGNDRIEYDIFEGIINIKGGSFGECKNLEKFTIPDSTECIESYAFSGCTNINNVVIPENVSKIDAYAFNGCWLNACGTIKFYRTSNINYNQYILYNCYNVTVYIPNISKEKYIKNDGTIIFDHIQKNNVVFYDYVGEII